MNSQDLVPVDEIVPVEDREIPALAFARGVPEPADPEGGMMQTVIDRLTGPTPAQVLSATWQADDLSVLDGPLLELHPTMLVSALRAGGRWYVTVGVKRPGKLADPDLAVDALRERARRISRSTPGLTPLTALQTLTLLRQQLNPDRPASPLPDDGAPGGGLPAADALARLLAPHIVSAGEDHAYVNGRYLRCWYLDGWPLDVEQDWLRPVYERDDVDLQLGVRALPAAKMTRKLRHRLKRLRAELEGAERRHAVPDYALLQRVEDTETMLGMIERGQTRPYQVRCLIKLTADSAGKLEVRTSELEQQIDALGARSRRLEMRQLDGWLHMLPLAREAVDDRFSTRNMHTQALQTLLPAQSA